MLPYYVVNAFTNKAFSGNPAGVVVLDEPIKEDLMQKIAKENKLSETAFILKEKDLYKIRWFTPEKEVDLCGHATLESTYVISRYLEDDFSHITFSSKSGLLEVTISGEDITLFFPMVDVKQVPITAMMSETIESEILEAYRTPDEEHLVLYLENQESIENFKIDLEKISQLAPHGVTLTAQSFDNDIDYVLRYFAPNYGINEDPVTGSAQTRLAPIWTKKLGKEQLVSKQLSERQGLMMIDLEEHLVKISGQANLYLKGSIDI
ncbi:PhzF family phenazine biosynthesis protein [Streptococcus agalactiae]|nr:Phenazine biosynthesis protein PhzF [Streptococcus agalactiae]EJZ03791.1 PhzF family phenazine biosynthesis protein [Streptococcus agalactiae STIR-CD-17]EPU02032.1 phenazine biosynthesis protein PhzF [Streptococcus agalactiae STIR-CD-09]EPU04587.1 phenazine biosynthesis protein PhzF [Streptococcus agalactiae STIR-CD-13]EPW82453.1 phenazine biosynthesis protein PhzF [Streptococcus agalactiae STIR-CD-07]CCQ77005.1 putative phenazine biosynthesis protein [Streptococcus agalactiae SS1219]CCQ78